MRRLLAVLGVVAAGVLAGPAGPAAAHPLGNFTVNAYSGLTVTPGLLRIEYVLDLAEIPTFQELARIDADGDGAVEGSERDGWARSKASALAGQLHVEVDGRPVGLEARVATLELLPGQGGLDVLRLEAGFVAPVPESGRVEYLDGNDRGRIGWREVTAVGTGGMAVTGSTVPAGSISGGLTAYPEDLLSSPPEVRRAAFSFGPGVQAAAPGATIGQTSRPGEQGGILAGLVARPDLSPALVLLALGAAFGVGALHALAPGHGKTVTAAYLAGAAGRVRHAVAAGAAVAVMHTAAVVGLGVAVLAAEEAFSADRVYPWLGLVGGAAAAALGAGLLVVRVRHRRDHRRGHVHEHHPPLSPRGLAAIALSGGLLPSPSAVVVLIGAASLGRLAFGLALIGAFGMGLAAAITAIGLGAVRARTALDRRLPRRVAEALPIGSAAVILAVGAILSLGAAAQL